MFAICILSVNPHKHTIEFLKSLKHPYYDLFICLDDISLDLPPLDNIHIIRVTDEQAKSFGFFGSVDYCPTRACSRDKALFFFSFHDLSYSFIWFLEEDVFIPSVFTLKDIDLKYPEHDLLCNEHSVNYGDGKAMYWQHWDKNMGKINYPWAKSLICAVRISHSLLQNIKNFALSNKFLLFDEMLFNTLAHQNNLSIKVCEELQYITFSFTDIQVDSYNPSCLYHPIRNIDKHPLLRVP
tara:strand:- start:184 stop:900 length:717 start_codon:yes stop_codon:yes gene_type:complete